jgi:alpha-tubulin suppressor-like RCC1 family protein
MRRVFLPGMFSWIVLLPLAATQSSTSDPSREEIKQLIVRIDSTLPHSRGFGAGIVLGIDKDQVYIVTANHVVREGNSAAEEITIKFRGGKDQVAAQLGAHYDVDQDLAVVVVSGAKAHGIDTSSFSFDRVGDPGAMVQGDPVFLVGHPQGVPWSVTVTPDSFIEPDEDSLRFESKSLFPGHSGGALLNSRLEIIGLLRSDQQPNGDALNIVRVLETLKGWGYPVQLSQRFTGTSMELLSAGAGHTCYVNRHGKASCWGENSRGQLGLGAVTDATQPSPVHGNDVFVSISAGFEHTCAITTNARAMCWGDDSSGQLGLKPSVPDDYPPGGPHFDAPVSVFGDLRFRAVSAGQDHTCGLTTNGQAYCWGDNEYGQLGTGSKDSSPVPAPVAGGHTFASVHAGTLFSCGIENTGALFCWGVNSLGQLGDGSFINRSLPVPVGNKLKFTSVSTGDGHACGVATNGRSYCWGDNASGQLGIDSAQKSPAPVAVTSDLTFKAVYAGRRVTYAITPTGRAYSWGDGIDELALSDTQAPVNVPVPVMGTDALTFKSLSLRFAHACGLTVTGELYCWGVNSHGQLGNGSKETRLRPTLVSPQP